MNTHQEEQAEAEYQQALAEYQLGRLAEAHRRCGQVLAQNPRNWSALHLMGIIAVQSNDPHQAIALFDGAIALKPDVAAVHFERGNALFDLHRFDVAIESYGTAIALKPDYTLALNNRGLALWCLKRHDAAIADYDKTMQIDPDNAEAYNYRGHALRDLQQHQAAVASYDKAIALRHDYTEAYNSRGSSLAALCRYEAALESYDRAIASQPDFAEAYFNRGNVLRELRRWPESLASYDHAIALNANFAEAHYKRADAQRSLGQFEAALAGYDRAMTLKTGLKFLPGTRFHTRMQVCDWSGFAADAAQLSERIARGEAACPPFALLAFSESAPLQRRAAEIFVQQECPPSGALPAFQKRGRHDRIRVGYFSAHFHEHPVAFLTAELFETHDRSAFEVTAFSLGPDTGDAMRRRLHAAFDRFFDLRGRSDVEIAVLARSMELDIAVDLGGFTEDCRPGIFALRAAPLQISYIGYLGTMAAPYMDYLIADDTLVPEASRQHYTENVIYLPSYQANDSQRFIAEKAFTREELGLPQSGFVFCCFNAAYKITPGVFAGWMLFLYAGNATINASLRREAADAGVDPDRLIFGTALPRPEYLARYRAAGLFLDTFPYNAGTTASDALWAGLPVLTRIGETFASRMAASLLMAVGISELITPTQESYEALAVELATNAQRLSEIEQRLAQARLTAPLFDTRSFTRHLETAYGTIYERRLADLPPADCRL
jgi:predicted O-linked N-acetylglucosamine transferase (SPINDLY family)